MGYKTLLVATRGAMLTGVARSQEGHLFAGHLSSALQGLCGEGALGARIAKSATPDEAGGPEKPLPAPLSASRLGTTGCV